MDAKLVLALVLLVAAVVVYGKPAGSLGELKDGDLTNDQVERLTKEFSHISQQIARFKDILDQSKNAKKSVKDENQDDENDESDEDNESSLEESLEQAIANDKSLSPKEDQQKEDTAKEHFHDEDAASKASHKKKKKDDANPGDNDEDVVEGLVVNDHSDNEFPEDPKPIDDGGNIDKFYGSKQVHDFVTINNEFGEDFDEYDTVLAAKKKKDQMKDAADKNDAPKVADEAGSHLDRPSHLAKKEVEIVHPEVLDDNVEKKEAKEIALLVDGIKSDLKLTTTNIKDIKNGYGSVKGLKMDERTKLKLDAAKQNLEDILQEFGMLKSDYHKSLGQETSQKREVVELKDELADIKTQVMDVSKDVKEVREDAAWKKSAKTKKGKWKNKNGENKGTGTGGTGTGGTGTGGGTGKGDKGKGGKGKEGKGEGGKGEGGKGEGGKGEGGKGTGGTGTGNVPPPPPESDKELKDDEALLKGMKEELKHVITGMKNARDQLKQVNDHPNRKEIEHEAHVRLLNLRDELDLVKGDIDKLNEKRTVA